MKAIVADRYGPPAVARERAAAGIAGRLGLHDPAAQGGELGELRVHAREHGVQPPALGLARRPAGVVRGERVDGLAEREADRLELAREPDPLDGAGS